MKHHNHLPNTDSHAGLMHFIVLISSPVDRKMQPAPNVNSRRSPLCAWPLIYVVILECGYIFVK